MGELKAGRELDELIAEKLFGWTVKSDVGAAEYCLTRGDEIEWFLPWYSSDIGAAWKVVQVTRTHPEFYGDFALIQESDGWQAGPFNWNPGGGSFEWSEYADTAPLAICLAALKACT